MAIRRTTDSEIQVRIAPKRLRWLEPNASVAWSKLHAAVDSLHGLCRATDDNVYQAETDADLSIDGVRRRRTELGRQALTELAQFPAFKSAEKAVLSDIELLEKKMVDLPQPPTTYADVAQAEEIRRYIRTQKSSFNFVLQRLSNPRVLGAVLNAEPFLTGLSDTEFAVVREKARVSLHPVQAEMQEKLGKALGELREGVGACQRLLLERTELRVDDDGQFRSVHEPPPRSRLTVVPPNAGAAASGGAEVGT